MSNPFCVIMDKKGSDDLWLKKRNKKERISIKLKLTLSHILIGVMPMLVVVILLLNIAKGVIMDEVEYAITF